MRILIVDDDQNGLVTLEAILQGLGHEVMAAQNGQIALELARITLPDLIISDILMPVMDGYQLCREWKRDGKLRNIPFIFYTATYTDSKDEELALSMGAERFIVKPVEPDAFSRIFQEIIENVKKGKVKAVPAPEEEKEVFKLYNERLIKKLEKKMLDLERGIAVRKQAEEALRESKERYRALFDNMSNAVAIYEAKSEGEDFIFIDFNKGGERIEGIHREALIGKGVLEVFPGVKEFGLFDVFKRVWETGNPEHHPIAMYKDERITGWRDNFIYKLPSEEVVAIYSDETDRKQAEEALRESEERFRTVADFTYDWEYWIAPDGQVLYISPSCERITGYGPDEFVNDPELFKKIVHPDDHSTVSNHLGEEQSLEKLPSLDFRITTRSGEERWINHVCLTVYGADGTYLGRRGSNRDISKQKQMQEELLKAKKLESLGVLSGGIAHDFNNILTAVLGNISLAQMMTKTFDTEETVKLLTEAEKAAMRAKDLTARLITFSQGGEPFKEEVSIEEFVKDSVNSALSGIGIVWELYIPEDVWPVKIDQNQMKQTVHNIVSNAIEAMSGHGIIKVYCRNIDISEKDGLALKHGKYVKVSFKDQGTGIAEENLSKVFDPYFSTKELGTQKGMGLGLAVAYSIVKKHGGLITIESQLGAGTNIHIYLPTISEERPGEIGSALHGDGKKPSTDHVIKQSPINQQADSAKAVRATMAGLSIQRVLVMDDEEMLRDVSSAMLSQLGYEVEVAVDGVEAIEMYKKARESGEPYDAVILDLANNVGMGGVEAIRKLLEIDPEIRAIVATGYSFDPVVDNYRAYGFCGAMTKPFGMDELSRALKRAIR